MRGGRTCHLCPAPLSKVRYLTHVAIFESSTRAHIDAVFASLFSEFWRNRKESKTSLIAFADFKARPFAPSLGEYLLQIIPVTLHSVQSTERERDEGLGAGGPLPGFESRLV